MPLALARTYRPKKFSSVAVQTHVSNTLKGAIARGRIAHGYLFCGPRGTGKTTLARVLAMALNCDRRASAVDGEPCGECASCVRIWNGSASLDVVEIDAASNRGVDDARDLRERAMYAPSGEGRFKVYIVDEAHMLTREAWNALLKVLEEPPPRVVFVFATTEPQKIAQAAAPVLSRLQRFDLKRISPTEIRARLAEVLAAEKVKADPDALAMIARVADGSMRDALSLTDQVLALEEEGGLTPERVREALGLVPEDEYLALLDLVTERRAKDVFPAIARLADAGVDLGSLLSGLADILRAQLAIALGGEAPELSGPTRAALVERRDRLPAADLVRMLSALTEIEPRFRRSGQQQLLLETLLVRFALFDRTVAIEDVLRGVGGAPAADMPVPALGASAPPVRVGAGSVVDAMPVRAAKQNVALNPAALAQQWPGVVEKIRQESKSKFLAVALDAAAPSMGPAANDVTVALKQPNEIFERALKSGQNELHNALRDVFAEVSRLHIGRPVADAAPVAPPQRVTAESVKADAVASLRKKDAVLGAAIDALDLDLIE